MAPQHNSAVLEPRQHSPLPAPGRTPPDGERGRYAGNRPLMRAAAALRADVQRTVSRRGWTVLDVAINRAGRAVYLLQAPDGETTAMFRVDVEDLVDGRATAAEIVERNAGADLAAFAPILASV